RAISVISAAGQAFYDPVADAALHQSLRGSLQPGIGLEFHDLAINDQAFAELCALRLLANIERARAIPEAKKSSRQPGS
ncbi:MAG: Tm-1-like ATP-binding domain-containing protein, partial [Pirellulaceae bacterium]